MSATKQEETRRSVSLVEQAAVHGRKCGIKSCPCKAVKDVNRRRAGECLLVRL